MPSLNTYTVVRWRVHEQGNNRVVVPDKKQTRLSVVVSDGNASSPEVQAIAQYFLSVEDEGEKKDAIQAAANGLITLVAGQKIAITAPPVPPP